jgi:hypothetical protein
MITVLVVGAALVIFNRIQKPNFRPIFVRVRATYGKQRFN